MIKNSEISIGTSEATKDGNSSSGILSAYDSARLHNRLASLEKDRSTARNVNKENIEKFGRQKDLHLLGIQVRDERCDHLQGQEGLIDRIRLEKRIQHEGAESAEVLKNGGGREQRFEEMSPHLMHARDGTDGDGEGKLQITDVVGSKDGLLTVPELRIVSREMVAEMFRKSDGQGQDFRLKLIRSARKNLGEDRMNMCLELILGNELNERQDSFDCKFQNLNLFEEIRLGELGQEASDQLKSSSLGSRAGKGLGKATRVNKSANCKNQANAAFLRSNIGIRLAQDNFRDDQVSSFLQIDIEILEDLKKEKK